MSTGSGAKEVIAEVEVAWEFGASVVKGIENIGDESIRLVDLIKIK